MGKPAISACVAFLAVANASFAQESIDLMLDQDAFSEAIEDHIEGKIKQKIRQDLTKRALETLGRQKHYDVAKGIPGVLASNSLIGRLFTVGKLAFTIKPVGEGSDIIDIPQQTPIEEGPETQWCINSCLSTNGGNPASSAYQQCVANNCYATQNTVEVMPILSNAAKYLIDQRISEGCEGHGGKLDPKGITTADLDGDGKDDLILADEWMRCNGSQSLSITCGVKVCESVIYLRRGSLLERKASFLGTGLEIGSGSRPTVKFLEHDLSTFSFGWNGNSFAPR